MQYELFHKIPFTIQSYTFAVISKKLLLLGAEFMVKKENSASKIDLEHYSVFFDKSIRIMKDLFGESAERVELKNAYNITATIFM